MSKYNIYDHLEAEMSITKNKQETIQHGNNSFPCAHYVDFYRNKKEFYPWHWHEELEIAYVTKGSVTVSINDQKYTLQANEGIFINTGILHAYSGENDTEAIMPNVLFKPSLIYATAESVYYQKYIKPLIFSTNLSHILLSPKNPWQTEVLMHIRKVFMLMDEKNYGYEFKIRSHLSELLLLIIKNSPEPINDKVKSKTEVERVRKMLNFIQFNFSDNINLQQIADSVFISRRECLRCFRHIVGMSPIQYVIELRIQKAKQLLLETDLPISDIYIACGFQNQSYFAKIFKSKTGLSPMKFRNLNS